MYVLFNIVMPVFGLIVTGYAAGRSGMLDASAAGAINRFVYYFTLPPLMFTLTARTPVAESLNWPFIAAFFIGSVLTLAFGYAVSRAFFGNARAESLMHGHAACFGNTVYLGLPLFVLAFGDKGATPAIVSGVVQLFILAPVIGGVETCLNRSAGAGRILGDVARAVATNPLLLASLAGIAFSLSGLTIPSAIGTYLDMLGRITTPAALFMLGLSLVGRKLAGDRVEVGWIVVVKLLVNPAVVWLLGVFVFALPDRWLHSAVLLSALPSGALVYVVAQKFDVYVARASASIVASTAVSVVTVTAYLIWMLGAGGY